MDNFLIEPSSFLMKYDVVRVYLRDFLSDRGPT